MSQPETPTPATPDWFPVTPPMTSNQADDEQAEQCTGRFDCPVHNSEAQPPAPETNQAEPGAMSAQPAPAPPAPTKGTGADPGPMGSGPPQETEAPAETEGGE